MNQINIATKKFTNAVKIDIGQLPVTDVKIDFNLTDGSKPVIAENKTFSMTIGTVNGELYKTDDDTVSYRYLKFDDNNVADSLAITMKMNGEEILNDTVTLTYQTSGGGSSVTVDSEMSESSPNPVANSTLTQAINNKADNDYLCFTAVSQVNGTIRLDKVGTPPAISLEYSTDKVNWTEYTWDGNTGATITLANIGGSVWMRGNNEKLGNNSVNYHKFIMGGSANNIEASGNIMSLLDKQLRKNEVPSYCFYSLFEDCTPLRAAPSLPATRLKPNCYESMFKRCTSLMYAPELPARQISDGCYREMFYNCSALNTAIELPASYIYGDCYNKIFRGCKNLNKVKVYFTSWNGGYTTGDWFSDASPTGVFECPSALDCSSRASNRVPAGWTIVRTDAPKSITSPTTASSEATYQVSPNTPSVPVVTVASALTLNSANMSSTDVAYSEIVLDVATGATVTAGTNLTLVDAPTAGKRNICVCRWSGGVCKLYVTIVEDLPQA